MTRNSEIKSNDKKAIIFKYDASYAVHVDEEFQKHWRGVSLEGFAEPDIERYLNSGITAVQGVAPQTKRPEKTRDDHKRKRVTKSSNAHLEESVLKDYSKLSGGK